LLAFAGMWIITMAATVSLLGGSMMNARIIACQLFAIAMWMLIIDVAGVTESTQLLAGFFVDYV
ncbi:membrane protein, partial [Klebsiella pneumoniae]